MSNLNLHRPCALLTVAVLACVALNGCETVDRVMRDIAKPSARLAGISLQDVDLQSATLGLQIEVTNPYSVPLPLVDLDYALASQGASFLSGQAALQGTVPSRGSRTLEVPARLAFREMLDALSGVRPGQVVPYEAELGLGVDAPAIGALRLPLRKKGKLPVPMAPEVSVREFNWDALSLERVGGVMVLDLINPNQFPLTMSRLDYGLQLAGVAVARTGLEQELRLAARGGDGEVFIPVSFSPRQLGVGLLSMVMDPEAEYGLDGEMQVDTPYGPMRLPAASIGRALFNRL